MLILNHPLITPLDIVIIEETNAIQNTSPKSFLIIKHHHTKVLIELAKYCQDNHISFAAIPNNITEALLLVNLSTRYLLTKDLEFAKRLQSLAETYLFDTKILLSITHESQIQTTANCGIDGVIFI